MDKADTVTADQAIEEGAVAPQVLTADLSSEKNTEPQEPILVNLVQERRNNGVNKNRRVTLFDFGAVTVDPQQWDLNRFQAKQRHDRFVLFVGFLFKVLTILSSLSQVRG